MGRIWKAGWLLGIDVLGLLLYRTFKQLVWHIHILIWCVLFFVLFSFCHSFAVLFLEISVSCLAPILLLHRWVGECATCDFRSCLGSNRNFIVSLVDMPCVHVKYVRNDSLWSWSFRSGLLVNFWGKLGNEFEPQLRLENCKCGAELLDLEISLSEHSNDCLALVQSPFAVWIARSTLLSWGREWVVGSSHVNLMKKS